MLRMGHSPCWVHSSGKSSGEREVEGRTDRRIDRKNSQMLYMNRIPIPIQTISPISWWWGIDGASVLLYAGEHMRRSPCVGVGVCNRLVLPDEYKSSTTNWTYSDSRTVRNFYEGDAEEEKATTTTLSLFGSEKRTSSTQSELAEGEEGGRL